MHRKKKDNRKNIDAYSNPNLALSTKTYMFIAAPVAFLVTCIFFYVTANSQSTTSTQVVDENAYDRYKRLAVEKGWSPVDPLEKFELTVKRYGQAFTMKGRKEEEVISSDFMLRTYRTELLYLLDVFKKSSSLNIDLTYYFYLSLDEGIKQSVTTLLNTLRNVFFIVITANKCIYRVIKEHLRRSSVISTLIQGQLGVASLAPSYLFP